MKRIEVFPKYKEIEFFKEYGTNKIIRREITYECYISDISIVHVDSDRQIFVHESNQLIKKLPLDRNEKEIIKNLIGLLYSDYLDRESEEEKKIIRNMGIIVEYEVLSKSPIHIYGKFIIRDEETFEKVTEIKINFSKTNIRSTMPCFKKLLEYLTQNDIKLTTTKIWFIQIDATVMSEEYNYVVYYLSTIKD